MEREYGRKFETINHNYPKVDVRVRARVWRREERKALKARMQTEEE